MGASFYRRLRDSGTRETCSPSENVAIQYANLALAVCLLACIGYVLGDFLHGDSVLFMVHAASLVGYGFAFLLIRWGSSECGKFLGFLTVIFSVALDVDATGLSANYHLYFLSTAALPFIIFTERSRVLMKISSTLGLMGWFGSFIVPPHLLMPSPLVVVPFHQWIPLISVPVVLVVILRLSFHSVFELVDVSQKQSLQLIHASRMAALGEMAAGLGHEINNPLTIIKGRILDLEDRLAQNPSIPDRNKLIEHISRIHSAIERIARVSKSLQFFSGDLKQRTMQLFRVSEIVESTLPFCRERLEANGIQLKIDPLPPIWVRGHLEELTEGLYNLLNNSIFSIQKMEKPWIQFSVRELNSVVELRITDSGPQIPSEIQEKMMIPFFTTKDVGQGMGLGLSLTKGIVERHGGKLTYDATSPHACFVIQLPLTEKSGVATLKNSNSEVTR